MCLQEVGKIHIYSKDFVYWNIPSFKILEEKQYSRIWSPFFQYSDVFHFENCTTYKPVMKTLNPENFLGLIFVIKDEYMILDFEKRFVFGITDDKNSVITYFDGAYGKLCKTYYMLSKVYSKDVFQRPRNSLHATSFRVFCEAVHVKPDATNVTVFEKMTEVPKAAVKATENYEINNHSSEISSYESDDVKRNDFRNLEKLSQNFRDLYIQKHDTDLVLMVKDREFKVHKGILRSRSPVFNAMFSHELRESNSGIVPIEDCEPAVFEEFLLYVYSGRAHISSENVCELYYIADKYQLQDLKEECVCFLKKTLTTETICDVICLSTKHNESELLDLAITFFASNMEEILVTVKWQLFLKENSTEANELIIKALKLGFTKKNF